MTGRTTFGAFLTCLVQYHIAEAVDDTKSGRLRADGAEIKKAMNKFGWKEAERPRFFQYLRQGRSWRSICQEHVGLPSLIPPKAEAAYGVSASDYLSMKGGELDTFAQMIDDPFVAGLAAAAAAFQYMALGSRHDAVFVWEESQPQLHAWDSYMTEATLLDMIRGLTRATKTASTTRESLQRLSSRHAGQGTGPGLWIRSGSLCLTSNAISASTPAAAAVAVRKSMQHASRKSSHSGSRA